MMNIIVYYDSKIESDDRHETETEFHGEIHYKNKIFTILGEKDEFEYKYLIHENGKKHMK